MTKEEFLNKLQELEDKEQDAVRKQVITAFRSGFLVCLQFDDNTAKFVNRYLNTAIDAITEKLKQHE